MRGFAGFLSLEIGFLGSLESVASRMALSIQHRAPDEQVPADAQAGIALGRRLLSIIDLSPAGHQPMQSASERFVITFNSEIYNHLEFRAELRSTAAEHARRGHPDAETLLAAVECWNVTVPTVDKMPGSLYANFNKDSWLRFNEKHGST